MFRRVSIRRAISCLRRESIFLIIFLLLDIVIPCSQILLCRSANLLALYGSAIKRITFSLRNT
jgi:hypothetical protein